MKRLLTSVILLVALAVPACSEPLPGPESTERWVVHELGTRAGFRDLFFLDAMNGWIVGGGHDIDGGIIGSTTDGGRTWTFRSGIVKTVRKPAGLHLNAVWFHDRQDGFIVGDGNRILRTVDGGEHWHTVSIGPGAWSHARDLQFVDRYYGWAVGNGGLVRTTDGGARWAVPAEVQGQAIHFIDRERGWLVGKAGRIRSTVDGGRTWSAYDSPPELGHPDLWGLDFADELHGWAVGESGAILHTSDGGASWRRQTSGVADMLTDVEFADPERGWAVGFERRTGRSVVLNTVDGGATWHVQARVAAEGLRALFVLGRDHAWAVGEMQRRSDADRSQKLLRYEVVDPQP